MTTLFRGAEHAKLYQLYRLTYPDQVYDIIIKFLYNGKKSSSACQTAVDIGCGTGISTRPLCTHFKNVIGIDPSEAQISEAKSSCPSNCEYRIGKAEDLSFCKDKSIDLVTVGQALHWLDTQKFYCETKRVLRPGGVLAAYGYGMSKCNNDDVNILLYSKYYDGLLGKYWDPRRKSVENSLQDLFGEFSEHFSDSTRDDTVSTTKQYSIDEIVGYISSWSGYQKYRIEYPDNTLLEDLRKELLQFYPGDTKSKVVDLTTPYFILLGRTS